MIPMIEAPAVVEAPAAALENLNVVVVDSVTGAGINGAACIVNGDQRVADGAGFINYAIRGPALVLCSAAGYRSGPVIELAAGDRRVSLVSSVPAAPAGVVPACGAANNTGRVSAECLEAVAAGAGAADYRGCQTGDPVACHRYVRAAARALLVTTGDPGWGLITKFHGQGCTLTQCAEGLIAGEQKYGEDMIAYLPKGNSVGLWTGIDVIAGAGAPGARYVGGVLPPAGGGRPDNLWAPVPRP